MSSYIPHPIPYQGSKRNIAKAILKFFPADIDTLIEPFAGSAALSIAAAYYRKVNKFHINDLNEPLMMLWVQVVNDPQKISDNYEKLWYEQLGREREYYDYIRNQFNKTKKPEYFLYLLARCVKGSVRYNSDGEFNQSPDNRRKGRQPTNMRNDIFAVSNLLKNKVVLTSQDYRKVLKSAKSNDLIYMDPPYQGVSNTKDPRYYSNVSVDELIDVLADLNKRKLQFIISYDGKKGDKIYGEKLPSHLELYHIELKVCRSIQATLLGSNEITYESLYLSKELLLKLENKPDRFIDNSQKICSTYYWAKPENYTHIALKEIRRLDLIWEDEEIKVYEKLKREALNNNKKIPDYVKKIIEKQLDNNGLCCREQLSS